MKTKVITVLLFFITLVCSSQSLVKEGKLWSNTEVGSESGSRYFSYYVKILGDTVFSETQYKAVLRSDHFSHEIWYNCGFIREDTINKRVFFNNGKNNNEELLYDFNLNKGDSVFSQYGYAKVDSVVYAPFGNSINAMKHIYLSYQGEKVLWVEGIGSTNGVLKGISSFGIVGMYYNLVCYSNNENLIYHNPAFRSCFHEGIFNSVMDINQLKKLLLISYQNDQIQFSLNSDCDYFSNMLQLFDLNGKTILKEQLFPNNHLAISKKSIIPGIYLYYFQTRKLKELGKIVIK